MPTSLGIMQTFFGPPLPPPPWEACWPTPHEAATRTRAINMSIRAPLAPPTIFGTFSPLSGFTGSRTLWSGWGSHLPSTEKRVEEHRHEQQDPQDEDLPGAWHPGQDQAVAQRGDDQDAEHGAAYGSRATVDARPAQDDGGDHVELQPEAGIPSRRVDPGGVDYRRHRHQQADPRVEGQLYLADGYAGETGRFLVVADGVDVAPETGTRQDQPHHDHREDEDEQLQRHGAEVRLPEVGEPVGEIGDRLCLCQAVRQALEQGEGAERDDQRVQIEEGDEEAVEEARGQPDYEPEYYGQRQREARRVAEPHGDRDQGEVGPHREVYPAGDDDQGHAEGHKAHLHEETRGVEQVTHGEKQRREQGHHYHQNDQHPEQHHFPGELDAS